jgi:hypothetical protein
MFQRQAKRNNVISQTKGMKEDKKATMNDRQKRDAKQTSTAP